MKKLLSTLAFIAPLSMFAVGCGKESIKQASETGSNELSNLFADEFEEAIADQFDDVVSDIAELDSPESNDRSLGLSSQKSLSLEKSCLAESNVLTVNKSKSKDTVKKKSTRKGSLERSFSHDFSRTRVYKPQEGRQLPVVCASPQGPVKIVTDKLADFQGLSVTGSRESTKSVEVKNSNGEILHSRSLTAKASRSAVFSSAVIADEKITLSKSVSIQAEAQIVLNKKGQEEKSSHSYATQQDAPLVIEVVRQPITEKLLSKTIKSGQVVINRASGVKIDISYEMVKFSSDCKPESGQLKISRVDAANGKSKHMSIRFANGEAFISKDGGAETAMESLNLRLEGCRNQ